MHPAIRSPIFQSIAASLERLPGDRIATCEELNALGGPVRFVEQAAPLDEAYEMFVRRSGEVPTRPGNWHDVFNALAWLSFPRTKAVLNRLHCEEIEARGVKGNRGTARDVLSLFDEGGVIVASADASLLGLLRRFEWKALFWERRVEVLAGMRFFAFGHAILEKALEPYKAVTAKSLLLDVSEDFLQWPFERQLAEADRRAADWFSRPGALASTRGLSPLPVMGVPGWAENARPDFYDDAAVFRSSRQ